MKHKGVLIEVFCDGKPYLQVASYVAHLETLIAGEPLVMDIVNVGRLMVRLTPQETDSEQYGDD